MLHPYRILSVVGARPNFMKVAPIHRAFQKPEYSSLGNRLIEHRIVHTGQHYDKAMSDTFFYDLDMPEPSHFLGVGSGSHAEQTAKIMLGIENVFLEVRPHLVLVVGDVNSTIAAALTAKKLNIVVAHVEAGLRSFDRTMPEELNRIATDAIADFAFVTEQSGMDNLRKENFCSERCYFVGNTMIDSLHFALPKAQQSTILQSLRLTSGRFVLTTLHRPSNVDNPEQLGALLAILAEISQQHPVVLPLHPRTQHNIRQFGLESVLHAAGDRIRCIEPQGYVDFLALMMHARLVMTDSGGVQEETTALGIPCLTLRTTTERPITCEIGTNILVTPTPEKVRSQLGIILETDSKQLPKHASVPPLWDGCAAERIAHIILRDCLPSLL